MTKEEAKEVIQRIRNCVGAFKPTSFIHFPVYRNTIPALDMAIKSLEQDRPIKTIQKPRECRNKNCVAMCSPAWAEFWFDKPDCPNYVRGDDRPIGHWIPRKNIAVKSEDIDKVDNLRWKYECSECGYEVREKHDYCVCGAEMVEPPERKDKE